MIKKSFKKTIALFISILMIISSLPFAAMTAEAATGTLTKSGFGLVHANGNSSRFNNKIFNIVNDQQADNTSAGIIQYNISGLKGKTIKTATLNYKLNSATGDSAISDMAFYYSTANIAGYVSTAGHETKTTYAAGAATTANKSFGAGLGFYTEDGIYKVLGYTSATDTSNKTMDIKSAMQICADSGSDYMYVVIMHNHAGGSGNGNGWSDTNVDANNFTISYETDERNAETYVDNEINSWTGAKANSLGSFSADTDNSSVAEYKNVYKNLLYASHHNGATENFSVDTGNLSDGNMAIRLRIFYMPTVMMWDNSGVNPQTSAASILRANDKPWNWDYSNTSCWYAAFDQNANGLSFKNNYWIGNDERFNIQWLLHKSGNCFAATQELGGSRYKQGSQGDKYYANIIQYNGDFTDAYKKITPTYKTKLGNDSTNTGDLYGYTTRTPIYVLNYKLLQNKVADFKSKYSMFKVTQSAKCSTKVAKVYSAVQAMMQFDPNTYFVNTNNTGLENAVKSCSSQMTTLMSNYDTAMADLEHNYETVDGTAVTATCKTPGRTADQKCKNCDNVVYGTTTSVDANAHDITGVEWTKYPGDPKHYKLCNLCNTIVEGEVHSYSNYTETTAATCDSNAIETGTCVCGATDEREVADSKSEHTPGSTVRENVIAPTATKSGSHDDVVYCTECTNEISRTPVTDNPTGDFTAYNNAVTLAGTKVETDYTAESWAVLQTALATDVSEVETQDEIDAATNAIVSAINGLVEAEVMYSVTVNVENEEGHISSSNTSVTAGTAYTATVDTDSAVSKWTVETNESTKKIGTTEKEVTAIINSDTIFTVYLANDEVVTDTNIKVTYVGYSGNITSVEYYANEAAIALDCDSHQTSVAFYAFDGWIISKVADNEYVYTATYAPATTGVTANVVSANASVLQVNKSAQTNAYYDSVVYLSGDKDKVVKMVADGKVSYFKNVGYMHVPFADNVSVTLVESAPVSSSITGQYKDVDETGATVAAFNANFYLPEDAELVECGAIMTVRDYVANDIDAFQIGTAKVIKVASNSQSDVNEYTIAFHGNFTGFDNVYGRSYVTYTVGGTQYTEYSAVSTIVL